MKMMNKSIFVDTNILVYATAKSSPLHLKAQQILSQYLSSNTDLWISRQIIREYIATLSRSQSFSNPVSASQLAADIHKFSQIFSIADDNDQVTQNLLNLVQNHQVMGKRIHDANIVATMLAYNVTNLITHNVSDFNGFSSSITIIPL